MEDLKELGNAVAAIGGLLLGMYVFSNGLIILGAFLMTILGK